MQGLGSREEKAEVESQLKWLKGVLIGLGYWGVMVYDYSALLPH
jgi:hypothetical protein